ncbi:ABC transporter permease [Paenirhodobacter populi]|uniref:ABC transporter permease n=1 Tax=Paenirhodobacter populi TaxID=2306993 RepID=A0A443JAB2_9RHOB|nr:ABC transporter permease [Sinirhodobacter populi]RWR17472.1 ABC transporter permease [Sinirhodobacter populi]
MTETLSHSTGPRAAGGSLRRLLQDPFFVIGAAGLSVLLLLTLLAPWIAPFSPDEGDLFSIEAPPGDGHLLGTDEIGRDVFSRLLYGGQVSVLIGLSAVAVQLVIGISLGAIAGYFGGLADAIVMRLTEIVMCFPFYAIAITLAAIFGASVWNVILIIGILHWTGLARLVRGEFLSLRERDFVRAARSIGVSRTRIIFRHLLRNASGPILVYATLAVANGILAEAALSFLGLGVRQPQASWGNMLSAAQSMRVLSYQWWLWIPPGAAIVLMVLSINFLGEAFQRVLNRRPAAPVADLVSRRGWRARLPVTKGSENG